MALMATAVITVKAMATVVIMAMVMGKATVFMDRLAPFIDEYLPGPVKDLLSSIPGNKTEEQVIKSEI